MPLVYETHGGEDEGQRHGRPQGPAEPPPLEQHFSPGDEIDGVTDELDRQVLDPDAADALP